MALYHRPGNAIVLYNGVWLLCINGFYSTGGIAHCFTSKMYLEVVTQARANFKSSSQGSRNGIRGRLNESSRYLRVGAARSDFPDTHFCKCVLVITARCLHIIISGVCIHHSSLDLSRPYLVVIWDGS